MAFHDAITSITLWRSSRALAGSAVLAIAATLAFPAAVSAQTSDAADQSDNGLEQIVVTARRQTESLQNTPIAVTAFTAQGLQAAQVNTIADINRLTPNLTLNPSASVSGHSAAVTVYIRGIGQFDFAPTADPGVGIYVDGVYLGRTVGGLLDVADVERLEVLRGPQGTLFGRNTIGGAINVISQEPGKEFGGYISGTVGSYDRRDFKAALNIPLSDKVQARVSLSRRERDGYVTRLTDGIRNGNENRWTGRIDIRAELADDFTARLTVDGTTLRERQAGFTLTAIYPTAGFVAYNNNVVATQPCNAAATGNPSCYNSQWITGDPYTTWASSKSRSTLDMLGGALTLEKKFGDVSLKSITSYRWFDSYVYRDGDGSPLQIFETEDPYNQRQFSQEFQLLGTSLADRLHWVMGAYFFTEKANNPNTLYTSRIEFQSGGKIDNDSYAAFGQAIYDFTDKLSATFGLRYTYDTKRFTADQFVIRRIDTSLPFGPGFPLAPAGQAVSHYDDWTPMADVSYKFTSDVMGYLRYSEGFKSGGYSFRFFPPSTRQVEYQPESVKVYEAGIKSTWFGGLMRMNGAVFQTDYQDIQLSGQPIGAAGTLTVNGGKARIRGAELEIEARPIKPLHLQFSGGYLDGKYLDNPGEVIVGLTQANKLPNAPKWTLSAAAFYDVETPIGIITPRFDWSYRSGTFGTAGNQIAAYQPGYQVSNASLSWRDDARLWDISAGVTNLFDRQYFTSGYASPGVGYAEALYARPREWSLRITRNF